MVLYARLYHFYRTALMRSIRLVTFVVMVSLILYLIANRLEPKFAVFFFNLFVMFEVFFHYKVSHIVPSVPATKNKKETKFDSFTMPAVYGFVTETKTSRIMKRLIKYPQIQLVLQKANITEKELPMKDIDKELLAQSAFETAQTFKGKFVTSIDVFVAYLFLIEKDSQLLFAKQLKLADLFNILYWVRLEMPEEETPKEVRIKATGGGIGEELVSGWTPETKKYTAQFTTYALRTEPRARFKRHRSRTVYYEINC